AVRPGVDALRPPQRMPIDGLFLAGDWTATGWPATMEGAVRSGYLAAEGILGNLARPRRLVQPDLPGGWLARPGPGPPAGSAEASGLPREAGTGPAAAQVNSLDSNSHPSRARSAAE